MSDESCPICDPPEGCKGYPKLWANLRRPDGRRWLAIHASLNEAAYPPLALQATTAALAAVDFAASGFAVLTGDERERRLATCRACEHYDGGRCRICGCSMRIKTWMQTQSCPIGKW